MLWNKSIPGDYMRMSSHVYGIKPPDEKRLKMKAIWDACREVQIQPPKKVGEFFGWEPPDESGVLVCLDNVAQPYHNDAEDGFEVDLESLPKDIKIIRFVNSY